MAGYTQSEMAEKLNMNRTVYVFKENQQRDFNEKEKKAIYRLIKRKVPDLQLSDIFDS